jgi:hypothetical protein
VFLTYFFFFYGGRVRDGSGILFIAPCAVALFWGNKKIERTARPEGNAQKKLILTIRNRNYVEKNLHQKAVVNSRKIARWVF